MIKAFKYLGILIFTVLISITAIYQYKKSNIYSELKTEGYFELVNHQQNLSQSVVNIYNEVYPQTTERFLTQKNDCPCRRILHTKYCYRNELDYYIATIVLKKEVDRKKCIKTYLNNFDFTHNCIGIRKASQFYFNSDLENLSKENITKLILMTKNPTMYNPKSNPDKLNKAYNEFINDL